MTPKEKAKELMLKFKEAPIKGTLTWYVSFKLSKRFALIAVDEILPIVEGYEDALSISQQSDYLEYWKEVKNEINKL